MKFICKKAMILAVITLLLSISTMPLVSVESISTEQQKISVDCVSVNEDGSISKETLKLTQVEINILRENLNTIMDELKTKTNEIEVLNFLTDLLNNDQYPLLSRIINYLIENKGLGNRNLVISQGWGLNLNPFKKSQTDFIKPLTFWHYAETSDLITMPSATVILNLNPFEFKTNIGSQLGLMFRFRGIFIHIPQQMPTQSYTLFLGSAGFIFNMEIPTLSMPNGF
jgi:hypothetical protein